MSQEFFKKQCSGFLNTPPLWVNEQFGIQQFEFPEVDLKSFQPTAIPAKIRLGHQMEHVFKQLIDHCTKYEVLLYNQHVREGKQTLGEIDFILQDTNSKELIHIELTYKFYIINSEISEPIHQLMGPNRRDMFFTKMEKIKNEQFGLLHTEEGAETLSSNAINHSRITHQTCFKAQLFEPYGSSSIHIRPLNKNCVTGYWLRFEEFKSEAFKKHQFYIPTKSQWVIEPYDNVDWMSYFETLMEINLRMLKEIAPIVWIKKSQTQFEKFFVVWW